MILWQKIVRNVASRSIFYAIIGIMVPLIVIIFMSKNASFSIPANSRPFGSTFKHIDNRIYATLDVPITRADVYSIGLKVLFTDQDTRENARIFIGGADNVCDALSDCGVTIALHIRIRDRLGNSVVDKFYDTKGHYGYSSYYYKRRIFDIYLVPDDYNIEARIVNKISIKNTDNLELAIGTRIY